MVLFLNKRHGWSTPGRPHATIVISGQLQWRSLELANVHGVCNGNARSLHSSIIGFIKCSLGIHQTINWGAGPAGEAMEIMTQLFWLIMSVELVSWYWEVKAFREIWTIFGRASVQLHISTDIVTLGFPVFPQEGINSPYSPKRVPKIGVTLIGKSKSVFLCKVLGLFRIWC